MRYARNRTNNCGVSEWISGDVGYVVKCNEQELYNALREVLQNEQLSKNWEVTARNLLRKNLAWIKAS